MGGLADIVHPPLIDRALFEEVQEILHTRGTGAGQKTHRSRHPYMLKGLVYCAICQHRMQGQRNNGEAYYRCRYASNTPSPIRSTTRATSTYAT